MKRSNAAARLAETIDESVAKSPATAHFIIAHSHGGNVALDARQVMLGNASNVHIVTMATPFLSIKQKKIQITDTLFKIFISISIIAFLVYRELISTSPEYAVYILALISLFSIAFGAVTLFDGIYRRMRKKRSSNKLLARIQQPLRRINNQSLLASGILLCAGLLQFSLDTVASKMLFWLLPTITIFFALFYAAESWLYNNKWETTIRNDNIPNLTILRSQRDEATLALLFGKITSGMARVAASISIVVSVGAVLLILLLLGLVIYEAVSEYHSAQECLARLGGRTNNGQCGINDLFILLFFDAVTNLWSDKVSYYFAFGLFICIALIILTALCKSVFGRELLYRSLNTIVDVYDTREGDKSYSIDWCAPIEAGMFNLRHSLYNNPDAVEKIIDYVNRVSAVGIAGSSRAPLRAGALPNA